MDFSIFSTKVFEKDTSGTVRCSPMNLRTYPNSTLLSLSGACIPIFHCILNNSA